ALYDLREEYAKQVNVAPFRIVNNRSLLQVISEMPRTVGELQLYGFQTAFLKKEANQILDALHKSEPIYDLPKLNIRNKADRDPEVEKRFYKLKEWREKMVSKRKFEPTLILSSRILKTIAKENPTSLNELEALRLMSKWKLAEYGPELLKVI
ncbi:MAG: HRDC domain-containing protein, partial [Leptonema sp. (in: Bacteria)]|nr:HRDC domain-containing protein [Leptonema sp. (in: bacteria)]